MIDAPCNVRAASCAGSAVAPGASAQAQPPVMSARFQQALEILDDAPATHARSHSASNPKARPCEGGDGAFPGMTQTDSLLPGHDLFKAFRTPAPTQPEDADAEPADDLKVQPGDSGTVVPGLEKHNLGDGAEDTAPENAATVPTETTPPDTANPDTGSTDKARPTTQPDGEFAAPDIRDDAPEHIPGVRASGFAGASGSHDTGRPTNKRANSPQVLATAGAASGPQGAAPAPLAEASRLHGLHTPIPVAGPDPQAPDPDGRAAHAQTPAPVTPAIASAAAPAPVVQPALAQPPVPMQAANWPAAVVAGPVVALLDAAGGSMVLNIVPEELGRLIISLSIQGDTVTVRFQAETPEAARLLLDAERHLAVELARFGMTLAGHDATADRRQPDTRAWHGAGQGGDPSDPPAPMPVPATRLVNLIA